MEPILETNEHTLVEAIVTIATAAQIIISKATTITVTTQNPKRYIKEFFNIEILTSTYFRVITPQEDTTVATTVATTTEERGISTTTARRSLTEW